MNKLISLICFLIGAVLFVPSIEAQVEVELPYSPDHLTVANGKLFFTASDGISGKEPWVTTVNAGVTNSSLLKDINLGTPTSSANYFADVNGTLFFSATDGTANNGYELWKSDGTTAGTMMVKDINPTGSSFPYYSTNVNGIDFFRASNGLTGNELWKSDGTPGGTTLVKDIRPGTSSSSPIRLVESNGKLFFRANDGMNGNELWVSDGTTAGTSLFDLRPGSLSSLPDKLTDVGGTLFFKANNGIDGTELWKSDGTPGGTVMVKDIRTGPAQSSPNYLTDVNGILFFTANDGTNGTELWKSDGTEAGTVMVKDIRGGSSSSSPKNMVNVNGTLFFAATDGINGTELWKSDGTAAGTVMVKDIRGGSLSSSPTNLAAINDKVYFRASDGVTGTELWVSDGTEAGTFLIDDTNPGSFGAAPEMITYVNGIIFFKGTFEGRKVLFKYIDEQPDDEQPTIACPGDETVSTDAGQCSATYTVATPTADDNTGVTVLRYRYRPVDENCTNISGMGWSAWTTDATQTLAVGKWKIQWQAKDAAGNQKKCSFCVTVADTEPPVALCEDITVQIGAAGAAESIVPDDVDDGSTDNCGIVSKTINGFASVIVSCANVGQPNMVELEVFDEAGLSHTCLASVAVEDNIDPEVTCNGLGFTAPNDPDLCTATLDLPVPPATDNCEVAALEYRYRLIDENNDPIGPWSAWTDEASNNVTLDVGRYRVRWRASDPSGNRDFCNYLIEIEDVEPPTIDCFNQDIVFNGEASIDLLVEDLAEASDNCDIASLTLDINEVSCEQLGDEITVTATAVDVNGLVSTCTSKVYIKGLPCGWSQEPDGVGCEDGNDVEYDVQSETFTVNSDACHNAPTTNTDEYAFAQYDLCGDGEILAQVTGISGTSQGWAGVTMRESNDPQAMAVSFMTNLAANHRREARVTYAGTVTSQLMPSFNRHWLKIQRFGDQFRAYSSFNGLTWFLRFAQTIPMEECIEVGLVVNGYNGASEISATFANVSVQGSGHLGLQANAPVTTTSLDQKSFSVFPNPTVGQVTVALGDFLEQEARLEVLDVNGKLVQLVREGILENTTEELNLGQLPAGLYFVRLQLADGTMQMQRVVLQPRP